MPYTFKHGDRPLEGLTIQRAVGRGGFGEVYYALTDSGKQVALKYLRDNPEIELRGISHVMNLKSPHLITIYDVRKNDAGEPFVIMEYVSGPSLHDLLTAEPGGLDQQKAAFFVCGMASGLNYLHERGIVHRDLKPGNIFYDDGYVKIGDYGLSKHISVSAHSGQTVSVGTVHYMAPEIGSGSYSKAIDIYALGVILYEMLTGKLPFTGSSMGEVLMRHLSDRPDTTGIPEPFASIIGKALAKDPLDRYQDVNEIVDVIKASEPVSESIASFDHTMLTRVPRRPAEADLDRTVTTPPRLPPLPPLDVRDGGLGAGWAEKIEQKADKLVRKLEKKAEKWEQKLTGKRGGPAAGTLTAEGAPSPALRRSRRAQVFVLFAVTVAVSIGLGVLRADDVAATAVASVLFIGGATIGALVTYFRFLQRTLTRHPMMDRLAYASIAAIFMVPAFAISNAIGDGMEGVILGPIAALLLCNWTQRIESGRRGQVRAGAAVWPAIVGLIGAAIAQAEDYSLVAGAICATTSLVMQAAAALWPLPIAAPVQPRPLRPPVSPEGGPDASRAGEATERGPVGSAVWPEAVVPGCGPEARPEPGSGAAAPAPPPVIIDAAQPSFVGRAANAGLSFFGKVFLLVGITAAVLFNAVPDLRDRHSSGLTFRDGRLTTYDYGRVDFTGEVPKAVLLAPLIFGSLLLIVSRRNDGGAHFLRGFAGCVLTMAVALLAVGPAAPGLRVFLTQNDWSDFQAGSVRMPLVFLAVLLTIALALLFWPKRLTTPKPLEL